MSKDTDERLDRLRAGLSATNLALAALMQTLPAPHREAWLACLAGMSARKVDDVGQSPNPALQAALRQMRAAEDRAYQLLQAAHRIRLPQERDGCAPP